MGKTYPKSISVVVPVRNEERHLSRFLEGLARMAYEHGWVEILLVEGGSLDATRRILEQGAEDLRRAHPSWRIRILDNPAGDIPGSLNLAILESRGEVVLRLDAHTVFPGDYLERCVETLVETEADNVGGVFLATPGSDSRTAKAIARAREDLFGAGNSSFRVGRSSGARRTVPYGCFLRSAFLRYGLFDARLRRNQDIEFNGRIRRNGGTIYQNGEIGVHWLAPHSFGALWQKTFANGKWNVFASAVSPGCLSPMHALPGLLILVLFLLAVLDIRVAAGLLLMLAAADLVRACFVARGVDPVRLALAFFVIQIAHGLGQWWGLAGLPRFLAASPPDRHAALPPSGRELSTAAH